MKQLLLILIFVSLFSACTDNSPLQTRTAIAIAQQERQLATSISATETAVANATMQTIQNANATATQAIIQVLATETQIVLNVGATQTRIAQPYITSNADWTPIEQEIDGIVLVRVPVGCFMMGSTDEHIADTLTLYRDTMGFDANPGWFDDEQPVHMQCLDNDFWIDKYEVTQADFEQLGGEKGTTNRFTGEDRPVDRITWHEAQAFCEMRGGRLPTEAEWEYVARGPDNLLYPWGNEFVSDNVVYRATANGQTAPVGSHPEGASWVGAEDMLGNVREWVLSEYREYPYDPNDGRENISDTSAVRGLRGSSWDIGRSDIRTSDRFRIIPGYVYNDIGFRCVLPDNGA